MGRPGRWQDLTCERYKSKDARARTPGMRYLVTSIHRTITGGIFVCLGLLLPGCFAPWVQGDDPASRREQIKETLQSEKRPRIVSEIAFERMITLARLENVGLVTGLPGTGGKVKPSQPREKMLAIMRRWDSSQPNTILDDPSTTMVVASVNAPPAARRGQMLDVNIQLSTHAEASSLRQGWLMKTSLVEMSRLGGQVREGFEMASAVGQIVTAAEITGSQDPADQTKGIVVGGAQLLKTRELGIGVEPEFADAVTMNVLLPAINKRFTAFNGRKQTGIATPLEDSYIKLDVPPRYWHDPYHFINVVLNLGFSETEAQLNERIELLRRQLQEPTTVKKACWQLEAIGPSAIPYLAEMLNHPNPEIRFYIAHSLAYLNDRRAIAPLADLCVQQPAFRAMSLSALAIIDNYEAADALSSLLHATDAETRYGAVRALRLRDAGDPQVAAQSVIARGSSESASEVAGLGEAGKPPAQQAEVGKILEIPSSGPPLVVVSLHQVPEVVIFGANPVLRLPSFVYVTPSMMLNTQADGTVTVSRFEANQEDRQAHSTSDLHSLLIAIAEVGGTYGNWVSFIREASQKGYLSEPIAINPVPQAGRAFKRQTTPQLEPGEVLMQQSMGATPPRPAVWYNPLSWVK
jgi:hypothetical protein